MPGGEGELFGGGRAGPSVSAGTDGIDVPGEGGGGVGLGVEGGLEFSGDSPPGGEVVKLPPIAMVVSVDTVSALRGTWSVGAPSPTPI